MSDDQYIPVIDVDADQETPDLTYEDSGQDPDVMGHEEVSA